MRTLVTGASRGIGAALMDEGRARGHDMVGTSRAGDGDLLALDVTDDAQLADCAARVGAIDALICNAGVFLDRGVPLEKLSRADMSATMEVNVVSVAMTVQAMLPNLGQGGRIAIIASQMGRQVTAGDSFSYRASKAAAINLAMNLSAALRPRGIAVAAFHPGWVRTDMGGSDAAISPEESAKGLWDGIAGLDLDRSGMFLNFDGSEHPI